jgi:hypothetical protein
LIGTKVWFGPRRLGWGLDPVSVEGFIVVGATIVADRALKQREAAVPRWALPSALVAVALLKGTPPGGPKARRAFKEARRRPAG